MYDQFLTPEARELLKNTPDLSLEDYVSEETKKCRASRRYTVRAKYYKEYDACEIDDHMIMYMSFSGSAMTGNPGALFRFLFNDPRFAEFKHVISLEKGSFSDMIRSRFTDMSRVVFAAPDSDEYLHGLATAKYLVCDNALSSYYIKKPGQVLVNTWHGIPGKAAGYDRPDGNTGTANIIRNFLFTDYLVSPVSRCTDIFASAFKLDGIFDGAIIEAGSPGIDTTLRADRRSAVESVRDFGVNIDPDKKIILYVPSLEGARSDAPELVAAEFDRLRGLVFSYINPDEYQLVIKPHRLIHRKLVKMGLAKDYLIPAAADTNELLGITDILIADCSETVFDFLATGRPFVLYDRDREDGESGEGLYFSPDMLPGQVCRTPEEAAEAVEAIASGKWQTNEAQYEKAREIFACHEDGRSCL